jgi:hypothetical protein
MTDGVLCLRSSSSAIATDVVGWRGWGGKTRRKVTPSLYLSSAMDGKGCDGQRREGAEATEKAVSPPQGAVNDRSLLSVAPSSLLSTLLSSIMLSPFLSTPLSSIKPSPSCRQDHPPPFSSPRTPGYPLDGNGGNVNHPGSNRKKTFTQADARSNLRPTMTHSSRGGRGVG